MKQYHDLLRSILKNGVEHRDRTGVGTISHFGFQTRFDLREGFPIVTTKRVPFRWVAEELFWFLSGDTSEANLRARGVDIWAEWAEETFGAKPCGTKTRRTIDSIKWQLSSLGSLIIPRLRSPGSAGQEGNRQVG
jgi:thymidylate synthase